MSMQINKITDTYAVSPQIALSDIAIAAQSGYKAIINNRPDGEIWGQMKSAVLAAEAKKQGVDYYHFPVQKGGLNAAHVESLNGVLAKTDGPVLAFCTSGMRSSMVWAVSQIGIMDSQSIVQTVANAGYDISGLRAQLT